MTYKQIETSREIRLWLGQIIIPAASLTVAILSIPEVRYAVAEKARSVKESIQYKIRRKRKEKKLYLIKGSKETYNTIKGL